MLLQLKKAVASIVLLYSHVGGRTIKIINGQMQRNCFSMVYKTIICMNREKMHLILEILKLEMGIKNVP